MVAADAADVLVAGITGLCGVIGAGLGLYGVVYTVRSQKKPKVITTRLDKLHAEREARVRAEAERDAWRQIALARRDDLPD